MLSPNKYIRKAIINRLTGNVIINGNPVPVFNRIPSNSTFPFIRVYSFSLNESDFNQSSFITQVITKIEVVTRYQSDNGGELDADNAVNKILELIRTRSNGYFDLSGDGFNVFTCINEGITDFEDDDQDYTYFRKILEISNKVQQI